MLAVLKKYFNIQYLRLIFILFISILISAFTFGYRFFASAYSSQVNIYPSEVSVEESEFLPAWLSRHLSLNQDLSTQAELKEFNAFNSAHFIIGAVPVQTATTAPFIFPSNEPPAVISPEINTPSNNLPSLSDPNFNEIIKKQNSLPEVPQPEPTVNESLSQMIETEGSVEPLGIVLRKLVNIRRQAERIFALFTSAVSVSAQDSQIDKLTSTSSEDDLTTSTVRQSLIFSNFNLPTEYDVSRISNAQLRLSLAAMSQEVSGKIMLEYQQNGENWLELGNIVLSDEISNSANGGYFLFGLPIFETVEQIGGLKIRLSYVNDQPQELGQLAASSSLQIYLDSLWIELNYQGQEDVLSIASEPDAKINLISHQTNFQINEIPEFNFLYQKKLGFFGQLVEDIIKPFWDHYSGINLSAKIFDPQGREWPIAPEIRYLDDGEFVVSLPRTSRDIKPGKHTIEVTAQDGEQIIKQSQQFIWGVLAFNTNKSIYLPGETAYLQIGVLDHVGHTVCTASLDMEITKPNGEVVNLSTVNGEINYNPECAPNNVINSPDYFGYFTADQIGSYQVKLISSTAQGINQLIDSFEAREQVPFDIERIGPTRIFPWSDYRLTFKVRANQDFIGDFKEYLPASFKPLDSPEMKVFQIDAEAQEISWEVDWRAGQEYELIYRFDAPDISPEFYLLGPARIGDFGETRQWQIAADANVGLVYAEQIALDAGTTDTSNWTNAVVAPASSFTASTTYFIYVTGGFSGSVNTVTTNFEIVYGTSTQYTGLIKAPSSDAFDAYQISWFDVFTQPASTTNVILRYRTNSGRSYSLHNQIFAISLSDLKTTDYAYNVYNANFGHSATAMQYGASTTIASADNQKDWLVFAMEELVQDNNSVRAMSEIYNGSTSYMQYIKEGADSAFNELYPHVLYAPFTDVSSTTVFGIRVRDSGAPATGSTNDHGKSKVFALNLDAFENQKTLYADINVNLANNMTALGNLNAGGNYTPSSTADQLIFSSFINDVNSATADSNDELLVNGTVAPASWDWEQGVLISRTAYDATDELLHNIVARASNIPTSTGAAINIRARRVSGNFQYGDEVSMSVFSTVLKPAGRPTGVFNSAAQKTDGSGIVDLSIQINDNDKNNVKAKLEYALGANCNFTYPQDPSLDEATTTISASFGSPRIDNAQAYQVGTSTGWIITASGSNTVNFDWLAGTDLANTEGSHCLRLTANNGFEDQLVPATTTLIIDTLAPSSPGQLATSSVGDIFTVLSFGASSTDSYFKEYKIFYKSGTPNVSEADFEHSDINLSNRNYNGASTTRLSGLLPETQYFVNIWAYDDYGNRASSTEITFTTQPAQAHRGRSVQFFAGSFSSVGSSAGSLQTNANNTLPSFEFKLGETNATIRSAYILFESQFEAYIDTNQNHTAYRLAFDTCSAPCTPNAFSGTSSASVYDNTVLAYEENESNIVRLLLDVTNEAQLAAYSGGGLMKGQVGYRIEQTTTSDSIAHAKALLVVSYSYVEEDSTSYTNTVYYPLESTVAGHQGSRKSSVAMNCSTDLTCPKFNFNMYLPELSGSANRLSYWFKTQILSDDHTTTDVLQNINLDGYNYDSSNFIHEAALSGTQGNTPEWYFDYVNGYSENATSTIEAYIGNSTAGSLAYLVGGEVAETYIASSSAATKTRTVAFPFGVINNGQTTAQSVGTSTVWFPENGISSGIVKIQKAWIRILTNNYNTGANTITISTKVGNQASNGPHIYNYNPGATIAKPSFRFIHLLPASDYAELELANATSSKNVVLTAQNNNTSQGGLSAELVITYTYTDEANGYLSGFDLFAGQPAVIGNSQLATSSTARTIFPELTGNNIIRGASLLASYLNSDSTGNVPAATMQIDANLHATSPSCANAYFSRPDGVNGFTEFYKNVTSILTTVTNQRYVACYSNTGAGSATGGAKMNGILSYTYQYNAPQPRLTQNDWRWYENIASSTPIVAKAGENTGINNINIAEVLRLRMNMAVSQKAMATSTNAFKLQYGWGINCSSLANWTDVGGFAGTQSWRGYNNPGLDDGISASSALLASSTKAQTYEEENPSANNLSSLAIGEQGEWDWVLYNYAATSSQQYCFRMVRSDGSSLENYQSDGYPIITTAPANTAPTAAVSLGQYKNSTGTTTIANAEWINNTTIRLAAQANDVNIGEQIRLYFELIPSASSSLTATSEPATYCPSGTAYTDCPSRIWTATSSISDFRTNPFRGTTTITSLPENNYKWQALSCDDGGLCSSWSTFALAPNIRVDLTSPNPPPGALSLDSKANTSITLQLGATTSEPNFSRYRIFYKVGTSGVTEANLQHSDANLNNINYNGRSTTTVIGLTSGLNYVFNIWAYDQAGNKASATPEFTTMTESSLTEPIGSIVTMSQKTDGTGAISIVIRVDDDDNDDQLRAKAQYRLGDNCDGALSDPYLDDSPGAVTATYGSPPPQIDNNAEYQVGTTASWIVTSPIIHPGYNYVTFDWLSKTNEPSANNTYCVKVTINDQVFDQISPDSRLILIDNLDPEIPGNLSLYSYNSNSARLTFGSRSSDSSFKEYRIYYKEGVSDVTTANTQHIDSNLGRVDYFLATSTLLAGLNPGTDYVANIWAYDSFGNATSAAQEITFKTNTLPGSAADLRQYKNDSATAIVNGSWTDENTVKLTASAHDVDTSERIALFYQFLPSASSSLIATSQPATFCLPGTAYPDCQSRIWAATSSLGDYSVTPFTATATIAAIPNSLTGYKWQVLACNDDGDCANSWTIFSTSTPNIKIDGTAPTSPGALSESSKTSVSITLSYGASTTETNFKEYRIFYATSSPVSEVSLEHDDANLDYQNYNNSSITTISGLSPQTFYYFVIYAYDQAGNKASSSQTTIQTGAVASTPGALFYSKNNNTLYYRIWNGNSWNPEAAGPSFGVATDIIRFVHSVRSDDGSKIAVMVKTVNLTPNPDVQKWFSAVYRVAANNFVNSYEMQSITSNTNNSEFGGCLASLSGGGFFAVKNNGVSQGSLVYSWNSVAGWTSNGSGPDPLAVMNGCSLTRRPGTDNYLLVTFDDDSDVGTSYYYGGSAYVNNWTSWTQHSANEDNINNFVGEAFFDPSDNTRGGFYYSNSDTAWSAMIKKFAVTNNNISYGSASTSPTAWADDFVHGELAFDPTGIGVAYFAGRDIVGELNIYKIDISGATPSWIEPTNGDNISGGTLYSDTNFAQKPFTLDFSGGGKGIVLWNGNTATTPRYRQIYSSSVSVDAANSTVPGADANIFPRVRIHKDPNENELLAIYQNDDIDYSAVFWDGNNDRFYSTGNQAWTELVTGVGTGAGVNNDLISFSFSKRNSAPNAPINLEQYSADGATAISNGGWTNQNEIKLKISARDVDTSEAVALYLELINTASTSAISTATSTACSAATPFINCPSKLWLVATSTVGDYSVTPFTATATITAIPDSTDGYKWQAFACDIQNACSGWTKYNLTVPNFKVDTIAPNPAPGSLSIAGKTSTSVTLQFGSAAWDANFKEYKIFYKIGPSGVTEANNEHNDPDLGSISYGGTATTTVFVLETSTQYVFNIWAYDWAGNKATATTEIATTTNASFQVRQSSYRFENDDGPDVNNNTAAAAASTTLTNLSKAKRLNVRIQLENIGGDTASNKVYKLQYEDTASPGIWIDVGNTSDISYSLGLSGNNNDIISASKAAYNANTWSFGRWHENANQTANYSLLNNNFTEFVFAVRTDYATLGRTYRLRLYNVTDSEPLHSYLNYPAFSVVAAETKRFSKNSVSSLSVNTNPLTYFLDPLGYANTDSDNSVYDRATSSANIPVFNFSMKNSSNSDSITVSWNGQSTNSGSTNAVSLQVFRFGATNSWVTIASDSTSTANVDFTLSAYINSNLSQYYDGSYWSYYRVYQSSGNQTLSTDLFSFSTSTPTVYTEQAHFRWRNDDGSETTATWRGAEDVGDPAGTSTALNIGSSTRLRIAVANSGAGSAGSYIYRLEYATTTTSCNSGTLSSWTAVPAIATNQHFVATTSSYFANNDNTTAQLSADGRIFTTGKMVEHPSATTSAITLNEGHYTEIEYVLNVTGNAATGTTYCFRATNNGESLNLYSKYAEATLAGVSNVAPSFFASPSDNASATSTPTNYGSNVLFTATGNDPQSDRYYLAVCQTNAISPGNNGPPTCTGGSWCVSTDASSTVEATCSYQAATSSESLDWFAFLCDKRAGSGVAKCSTASQGYNNNESDSPFVVNHYPLFTNLATTVNYRDPGGTFTISASSSDPDSLGGQDTLRFFVCRANSADEYGCGGGASNTVCFYIGAGPNPSCDYVDTAPSPAATTTYYGFVFDSHYLAATSNSRTSSYTVNNVMPSIGSLTLNGGANISLNIKGAGDKAVVVYLDNISDDNGCTDFDSASAVIYYSPVGNSCSQNHNNCYPIINVNCIRGGCAGDDDYNADYACTGYLKYFAIPTSDSDENNPYKNNNWLSYISIFDGKNYAYTTSGGVEIEINAGLEVVESAISFGSYFVGRNSATSTKTTSIENIGNSPIDTNLSGTNLSGSPSGSLLSGNLEWSKTQYFNYGSGNDLSIGGADVDINTPRPTSLASVVDYIYWGIGIPYDTDAAVYNGVNTFFVVPAVSGW